MASARWRAARRPTGVEEPEQMDSGVPQELGRPSRLHGEFPAGAPDQQLQAAGLACGGQRRYEHQPQAARGIAERSNRSAARRTTGRRSVLIVPLKSGNSRLDEDPAEGSETPHHTGDVGNYVRCSVT